MCEILVLFQLILVAQLISTFWSRQETYINLFRLSLLPWKNTILSLLWSPYVLKLQQQLAVSWWFLSPTNVLYFTEEMRNPQGDECPLPSDDEWRVSMLTGKCRNRSKYRSLDIWRRRSRWTNNSWQGQQKAAVSSQAGGWISGS